MSFNFPKLAATSFKLIFAAFCLCSCAPRTALQRQLPESFAKGHLESLGSLSGRGHKTCPLTYDYTKDKNAVWRLLNQATAYHSKGDFERAISCYKRALEAIDYYRQESTLENFETLVLDERRSAYSGDLFEQLLSRFYFALALEQANKPADSMALLRQHEQAYQLLQDGMQSVGFLSHIQIAPNPVAKYLLACKLEAAGDYSNAKILFESAQKLTHAPFITHDVEDLGKRQDKAWLVIIIHKGLAPRKEPSYVVAATASAVALESYLKSKKIDPVWTTLSGLAVPEYRDWNFQNAGEAILTLDESAIAPSYGFDISKVARAELNQKLPIIAAKALARQILRYGLVHNHYVKPKASTSADLLLLLANINTRADIRSWQLLPSMIQFYRADLEPGPHRFEIRGSRSLEIDLRPGLNLIEVYEPYATWVIFGKQHLTPTLPSFATTSMKSRYE